MLRLTIPAKSGQKISTPSVILRMFRGCKINTVQFINLWYFLFVLIAPLAAQNGSWIHLQLPGPIGDNWSRDIGGNCCIFVYKDSNYVKAYDNVSGRWNVTSIQTNLPWENTSAGDSVALIWSSEHIVGYSALSQTFVTHSYIGTLIGVSTPDYGYGTGNTLACVLTADSCYVFDAEDSQWHIYGYQPPAYGDSMHISLRFENDYLLVSLVNRYGWVENTLIAYSRHQKSFWELNGNYIVFQLLKGGFAFYRDFGEEANCYLGAWSALYGQDAVINHQKPSLNVNEQNQGTACIFQTVDDSNYPEIVHYYYGYDTRHGTFKIISVSNNYGGDEKILLYWELWKNSAVLSYRYDENHQTEYYIYSGDTHSFTYFGPTDLGYDPPIHPNYGHTLGNNVMMASGCSSLLGYDLKSGSYALAGLPAPTSGYQNPVSYWSMENNAHAHCKRVFSHKFHIYTYHRLQNTNITELVETVPDEFGYGYKSRFEQENVFGFLFKDSTNAFVLLLYSPTVDQWTRRVVGEEPAAYGSHRDYIYWADSQGDITIFNGLTNTEHQISFRNMVYWNYESHLLHRDNYFIAYTSNNQYATYSPLISSVAYYTSDMFSLRGGREEVVLYESSDRKQYFGYSAEFNTFTPLLLTEEDGIGLWPLGGDNTALVMTSEGSLYAFNPYGETGAIDEKVSTRNHPSEFGLFQNYPNPFNPKTVICYAVWAQNLVPLQHIDLSIYSILGQKVATLVNKKQPAGYFKIEWDASGFASGIYLYRLETDKGFVQTRKLVLLK